MRQHKLVLLEWHSCEREKYVWEDLHVSSWDETIGRIYLLKAHEAIENNHYKDALQDFRRALVLLAKETVRPHYYYNALADKALLQCFLGDYEKGRATFEHALSMVDHADRALMLHNRGAILVLVGAYSDALHHLRAQLDQMPQEYHLRFTLATCLLHMGRYDDAVIAYEQVMHEEAYLRHMNAGLNAARQHQQPDWARPGSRISWAKTVARR